MGAKWPKSVFLLMSRFGLGGQGAVLGGDLAWSSEGGKRASMVGADV